MVPGWWSVMAEQSATPFQYVCAHLGVGERDHKCWKCGGIMRRCCDSIVGPVPHERTCVNAKPPVVSA